MQIFQIFFFVFCILQLNQKSFARDWCEVQRIYCPENYHHIGCKDNNDLSENRENCHNSKIISLSDDFDLQDIILGIHNDKRNKIASGKIMNFPSASKLGEVMWDYDLQELAEMHVKNCEYVHDECRSTPDFPNAGQNIGWISENNPNLIDNLTASVTDIINSWWEERHDMPNDLIRKFDISKVMDNSIITHFATMIKEKNTKIGCGLLTYETNDYMYNVLLTCNYAEYLMAGEQLYEEGKSCSNCEETSECSIEYPHLCQAEKDKIIPEWMHPGSHENYHTNPNNFNFFITNSDFENTNKLMILRSTTERNHLVNMTAAEHILHYSDRFCESIELKYLYVYEEPDNVDPNYPLEALLQNYLPMRLSSSLQYGEFNHEILSLDCVFVDIEGIDLLNAPKHSCHNMVLYKSYEKVIDCSDCIKYKLLCEHNEINTTTTTHTPSTSTTTTTTTT